MTFFFLSVIFLVWLMQLVVAGWLCVSFPQLNWKVVMGVVPAGLTLLTLFGMIYTRAHYHSTWDSLLYHVSYVWFGWIFIAFCLCSVYFVVHAGCLLCHLTLGNAWKWASWGGIVCAWFLALWGGWAAPQVKKVLLNIPGAPPLKAAVISDAHLGIGVSYRRWEQALKKIEATQPDVVFVLGDLFEYGPRKEQYAQRLRRLQVPLGMYGVLGNHEYYTGYEKSLAFYEQAGISLLQNEYITLPNGWQVAGVKDVRTARVRPEEIKELLKQTDPQKPLVLLSHTPAYIGEFAENGVDVMLSGHTHGGQIFPFNLLVHTQFPQKYGLFEVLGMNLYVTSGLFYWGPPLRLFIPSEIPLVEVNK